MHVQMSRTEEAWSLASSPCFFFFVRQSTVTKCAAVVECLAIIDISTILKAAAIKGLIPAHVVLIRLSYEQKLIGSEFSV